MEQQQVREKEQQEAAVRAALEVGRRGSLPPVAKLGRVDKLDEQLKVLEKHLARQERSEQGVARY